MHPVYIIAVLKNYETSSQRALNHTLPGMPLRGCYSPQQESSGPELSCGTKTMLLLISYMPPTPRLDIDNLFLVYFFDHLFMDDHLAIFSILVSSFYCKIKWIRKKNFLLLRYTFLSPPR